MAIGPKLHKKEAEIIGKLEEEIDGFIQTEGIDQCHERFPIVVIICLDNYVIKEQAINIGYDPNCYASTFGKELLSQKVIEQIKRKYEEAGWTRVEFNFRSYVVKLTETYIELVYNPKGIDLSSLIKYKEYKYFEKKIPQKGIVLKD